MSTSTSTFRFPGLRVSDLPGSGLPDLRGSGVPGLRVRGVPDQHPDRAAVVVGVVDDAEASRGMSVRTSETVTLLKEKNS